MFHFSPLSTSTKYTPSVLSAMLELSLLSISIKFDYCKFCIYSEFNFCLFFRAQHYTVQLPPDFECPDCTVRLLREAKEWSNDYNFWSCADVDIKSSKLKNSNCTTEPCSIPLSIAV